MDARTDSSTSVSTQQSDRSGRPPLPPQQQPPLPTDASAISSAATPDAYTNAAGLDAHPEDVADDYQQQQRPLFGSAFRQSMDGGKQRAPSDPAFRQSMDGGKRRRRLTAAGQAEAAEAEGQDETIVGPRPYARVGLAAAASPPQPHRQHHADDVHQQADDGGRSPGIAAHFQRRSYESGDSQQSDGSAVMQTATSGARNWLHV